MPTDTDTLISAGEAARRDAPMIDRSACVELREALKLAGIGERTFERRVKAGEVRSFVDPIDRRRRLIPLEDLDRLAVVRESGGRQPNLRGTDRDEADA